MAALVKAGMALNAPLARMRFEAHRCWRSLLRRFGPGLMLAPLGLICAAGALVTAQRFDQRADALQVRLDSQRQGAALPAPAALNPAVSSGAQARLAAFDRVLLPHAELPFLVEDLLELGAAEQLLMQRGTYRAQHDSGGAFLRYRMTLPVKGQGPAIQRFMTAALREKAFLALDRVQFSRPNVGSSEVEARIEWVVLTAPAPGTPR